MYTYACMRTHRYSTKSQSAEFTPPAKAVTVGSQKLNAVGAWMLTKLTKTRELRSGSTTGELYNAVTKRPARLLHYRVTLSKSAIPLVTPVQLTALLWIAYDTLGSAEKYSKGKKKISLHETNIWYMFRMTTASIATTEKYHKMLRIINELLL